MSRNGSSPHGKDAIEHNEGSVDTATQVMQKVGNWDDPIEKHSDKQAANPTMKEVFRVEHKITR